MITLFSGVPGSGKTYKMVAELSRVKDKYYVVHNIDGLVDNYLGNYGVNFVDYCKENNLEVVDLFSKEYQIEFTQKVREKYLRPVLVIIDEAHEWFDSNKKTLKMWLSYHRHLDQEIWLVAHRSTNLPSVYRSFIEIEYRAKSGSFLGIPGYFFYNRILGGQAAGYTKERKNQKIFAIYKSQIVEAGKSRKNPKMLLILLAAVVCLVVLFLTLPQYVMRSKAESLEKNNPKKESVGTAVSHESKLQVINNTIQNFSERWAFVGVFGQYVVLEDRITGEQLPLEKISDKLKMIEHSRNDSCLLYTADFSFVTVYNSRRYHTPVTAGRPLSPAVTGGDESS